MLLLNIFVIWQKHLLITFMLLEIFTDNEYKDDFEDDDKSVSLAF